MLRRTRFERTRDCKLQGDKYTRRKELFRWILNLPMEDFHSFINRRARVVDITTTLKLENIANYVETSKKQKGWLFLAARVKASEDLFQPPWLLNSFFYRRPGLLLLRRGHEAYISGGSPPTIIALERFFKKGNPCLQCKEHHYTNSFCRSCGSGLCTKCYMTTLSDCCSECKEPLLVEAQAPCVLLDPASVGGGDWMTDMYGVVVAQMRLDVELLHSVIVDVWATMPLKRRVCVIRLDEVMKIAKPAEQKPAKQKSQESRETGIPDQGISLESLTKIRSASIAAGWKLWPDERAWDQSESVLATCKSTFFIVLRDAGTKMCRLYWFRPLRRGKTLVMGCIHVCNGCRGSSSQVPLELCPGCHAVGYCPGSLEKCGRHAQEECVLLRGRGFTKSLGGATSKFEIKAFARPQAARAKRTDL
jgi:hypothetical protein